jgi:four helix bundle protein
MFRFEKLDIWKRSIDLLDDLFDVSEELDKRHHSKFAEQLRSASLSICNNIAEGSGSKSKQEFKQFLNFAHRSLFETANMVIIVHRRKFIDEKRKIEFLDELEQISKMIFSLISKL